MSDDDGFGRRQFLQWASGLGLGSILPASISDVAAALERRGPADRIPDARRGDPASPANLSHPLEREHVRERMERGQARAQGSDGAATQFESPALQRRVDRTADETIDLLVTTTGEAVERRGEGPHRRRLHGWRARNDEVAQLSEYGSIEYVNRILAPRVTLRDVDVDDVHDVARLPFVLRVTREPDMEPGSTPDADAVRSSDWEEFAGEYYGVGNEIRIGILDTGYGGDDDGFRSEYGTFDVSHAKEIGIDTGRAKSFTGGDWSEPAHPTRLYLDHGDDVADTAAYMLDPDHQEGDQTFVPLQITDSSDGWQTPAAIEAMEYCFTQGIQVLNYSAGEKPDDESERGVCEDVFCEELQSYTEAGYVPVVCAHNDGYEDHVRNPATSRYSIGVGGVDPGDGGDPVRNENSNYGTIHYGYKGRYSTAVHCDVCYESEEYYHSDSAFQPNAYGLYEFETPDGYSISGTSMSAPQVTAAAAIMQSNYLYDFEAAKEVFDEMTDAQVAPDEAARRGQLLDAREAYERTR